MIFNDRMTHVVESGADLTVVLEQIFSMLVSTRVRLEIWKQARLLRYKLLRYQYRAQLRLKPLTQSYITTV